MAKSLLLLLPALILTIIAGAALGGHESLTCADCHMIKRNGKVFEAKKSGPLWSKNHTADGLPAFRVYSSPTFDRLGTDIGQPDGASKLCLGCHDGSYPGLRDEKMIFGVDDLARSHPISFTYSSSLAARVRDGSLHDPRAASSGMGGTIADDMLDENGKMQCTSCHEMHGKHARNKKLLKMDNTRSRLCLTCHNL